MELSVAKLKTSFSTPGENQSVLVSLPSFAALHHRLLVLLPCIVSIVTMQLLYIAI